MIKMSDMYLYLYLHFIISFVWKNRYLLFYVYLYLHHPTILWAALNKNVNFLWHFVLPSYDMWSTQTSQTFSTSKLFVGAIQSRYFVGNYKIPEKMPYKKNWHLIMHFNFQFIKDLVLKVFSIEFYKVSKCAIALADFQF